MRKSYNSCGYDVVRKVLANCDKCSANNDSKVVRSPWGVFRMVGLSRRGSRLYTISGSSVFRNGGTFKIGKIRAMLAKVG